MPTIIFEWFLVYLVLTLVFFVIGLRYPLVGLIVGVMWCLFWVNFVTAGYSIVAYEGSTPSAITILSVPDLTAQYSIYFMFLEFLGILMAAIPLGLVFRK